LDRHGPRIWLNQILASAYTIAACRRHVDDLQHGAARGIEFNETMARMAIAFFQLFKHYKGEWAGQPITLEPWQQFIVGSLFGWRQADGRRRFRTAYISVARKNGKTLMAAGIGLFLLLADAEPGPEVYTAATKRDQARIAHGDAVQLAKRAPPTIKKRVQLLKDNIFTRGQAGRFMPLGRDSNTLDGLNVHGVIADELHAWKDRDLWDILETATGARRQPLMVAITTAGDNRASFCYQLDDYSQKVNEGLIADDSFFGVIYRLEPEDDYEDPAVWIKANPNLDVSKKRDDIARKLKRVQEMPAGLNSFLKREMNRWVNVATRWITADAWRAAGPEAPPVISPGRPAFAGLDLSSTIDVSALVYVFPPAEEIDFRQGYASLSGPMKELQRLIALGQLNHNNNPVLAWMAANVVATSDPAGNIKPDKGKSIERIDGIVALIMALDRASRYMEQQSVYETRGLRTV